MPDASATTHGPHGADQLPAVLVDSYNLELRGKEGFLGDRASKRAFAEIIENWRERLSRIGDDPLGETPGGQVTKKQLEEILKNGDAEAAALVHGAIEEFAQELANVIRRFLRAKGWQKTERIVVGGGFRGSRVGELAIGRAGILLKGGGTDLQLVPIRHEPDDAGLIGSAQLMPSWTLAGHDALLAVDIGGTNMRAGIVRLHQEKAKDLSKAEVWKSDIWRHADASPSRDDAIAKLADMLKSLIDRAKKDKFALAPFIGVGCPGVIEPDGHIDRGGQNLPGGNWESGRFNLSVALREAIPKISDHETMVVLHNDAVVQGLSEVPFMQDVERWGVLTIGTGLGNARFTNRHNQTDADDDSDEKPAKKGRKTD
jgi:predicted NBD/HSP70 family sugar kinase